MTFSLAKIAEIKETIHIFISSKQKEFESVRDRLSFEIGNQQLFFSSILKADLAEDYPSDRTDEGISKLIQQASLFILLIGYKKSAEVEKEFNYALSHGLPILAYEFYRHRNKTYNKIQTTRFRNKVNNSKTKIRGHDDPFATKEELIDKIMQDIPEELGFIANHYTKIKKSVYEQRTY